MIPKPYTDEGEIRKFSCEIDLSELIWHYDNEDRWVTIISGDWKIQFDNELPKDMSPGEEIFVKKERWHRIHKGSQDLIVRIKKAKD